MYKEEKKLLKSVQFSNWDVGVQASIIELLIGENLIYIHDMVLLANGEEEHFYWLVPERSIPDGLFCLK